MLIADAQVHIWAAETPERPWPTQSPDLPKPHRDPPLSADDLLREMDDAGVDRAVLISPVFEGTRNDLVLAAARAHPQRFAVMGRIDPTQYMPGRWLDELRTAPQMRGLRFTFHRPPLRQWLVEQKLELLWREAEAMRLPVMMMVAERDFSHVEKIAAAHPGLPIALDHMGLSHGTDEEAFAAFGQVLALARYPNVALKLSCLPHYTGDAYPFSRLHPWLRQALEAYGAQRLFWGSDLSRLPCPYRQCVTMFTEEMPWLSREQLEDIMGRALCAWLKWAV
ncbi:MAG TPA: amidohydrolase family protein [Burkholderiales bacterium]